MGLFDPRPRSIEFLLQGFRFVGQHGRVGQQIEQAPALTRHGRIKLPAGKHGNAARAHGLLDDFFVAGDALAGEPYVNRTEQIFADRSLGERKQQSFIHRTRRALRRGIELANRLDFVAEELDAHRAISFGRIHIENAAAQGVLPRHFHDIGGRVAHRVEVLEQRFRIERLAPPDRARQIGVVLGGGKANGRGRNGRNHERHGAGGDLPQGGRPFFLDLRMRGEILEGQHVARGQRDDGFGLGRIQ